MYTVHVYIIISYYVLRYNTLKISLKYPFLYTVIEKFNAKFVHTILHNVSFKILIRNTQFSSVTLYCNYYIVIMNKTVN